MQIVEPKNLTVEDALRIANCAIADIIGEESYEMCRLYHEDGVAMSELAIRHGVTRQRVFQRINATHTTLRRLSLASGIKIMPAKWERTKHRKAACNTGSECGRIDVRP